MICSSRVRVHRFLDSVLQPRGCARQGAETVSSRSIAIFSQERLWFVNRRSSRYRLMSLPILKLDWEALTGVTVPLSLWLYIWQTRVQVFLALL